jgi:hypothetical protein
MKKLNIHKDVQEPSLEDMEKHMNFEDVLAKAAAPKAAPSGATKGWLIGGAITATVITVAIVFATQFTGNNPATYESTAMESEPIEKMEPVAIPEEMTVAVVTPSEESPVTNPDEDTMSYDDYYPENEYVIETITYYEPKLVSSIPFVFDASFGLKEQWQAFEELSIYENLSFQPIDKAQQSMLKLTWDHVDFKQDESGQYFLILYKSEQGVICPVTPVFEKEHYLSALEAYQAHQ